MSTWKINLKEQTATSINGITFKLTETKPGEYEGVYLNPKDIPPDDLDDVMLGWKNSLLKNCWLSSREEKRYGDYSTSVFGLVQG